MTTVPRPGRKGGKIAASALTPPSEVKIAREPSEVVDKPSAQSSTLFDDGSSILQFDVDAIDHVAKGVVLGGTRNIRSEKREVRVSADEVETKMEAFMDAVTVATPEPLVSEEVLEKLVAALDSHDVVVAHALEGLQAAVKAAAANPKLRMLFIAPSIFNLEPTVKAVKAVAAADTPVGKFVGSKIDAAATATNLWVTDAKSAVHLLVTAPTEGTGFTHAVFLKLRSHQPVAQLAFLAAKSRKNFKILLAGCAMAEEFESLVTYVAPKSVFPSPQLTVGATFPVTVLTQEEACAFTSNDLVHVDIDRSGKFFGPHPRVVENCMETCIAFLKKLVSRSSETDTPQTVIIFTADIGDTIFRLQRETELAPFVAAASGGVDDCAAASAVTKDDTAAKQTVIHVLPHFDVDECISLAPTVVIDKGTIKMRTVNRSESMFPSSRTEWQSAGEAANRRSLVGVRGPGMIVQLFPSEAAEIFPKGPSQQHLEVVDLDGAILQCSRHERSANLSLAKLFTKYPAEAIERAMLELSEVGGVVSRENAGFTFLGEILGRLPYWTDMSFFVVLSTILGLGEVAAVVASVSAIHLFQHRPSSMSNQDWTTRANSVRTAVAGDQARTSDLLSDAALFLRWLSLSLSTTRDANEADEFAQSVGCDVSRMETIAMMVAHTLDQLKDYAVLDSFATQEAVSRCSDALNSNWDTLSYLLGAAACRKCAIVRNEGELHARDTAASMMFLRTTKTAAPNLFSPSGVAWRSGNALIASGVIGAATHFFLRGVTTIRLPFLFNSILMFHPALEVSSPQQAAATGDSKYVFLGVTANDQLKRFRVPLEDAAKILDFRQGLCEAFGCLQSLRSLPRGTTLSQYTSYLQSVRPAFHLKSLRLQLLNTLRQLVQSLEPTEESRSFQTNQVHRLSAVEVGKPLAQVADPSDDITAAKLWKNDFSTAAATTTAVAAATPSPAVVSPTAVVAAPAPFVEDDEEIETEESYFMKHGPIVEDEDE